MRGPATTTIRSSGTRRFASGYEAMTRRRRGPPTPDPPTVTMQTFSSARYPSFSRMASRSANCAGSNPVM